MSMLGEPGDGPDYEPDDDIGPIPDEATLEADDEIAADPAACLYDEDEGL